MLGMVRKNTLRRSMQEKGHRRTRNRISLS